MRVDLDKLEALVKAAEAAGQIVALSPDVVLALIDDVRAFRSGLEPHTAERCACGHRRVQHLFNCMPPGGCDCKRFRAPSDELRATVRVWPAQGVTLSKIEEDES